MIQPSLGFSSALGERTRFTPAFVGRSLGTNTRKCAGHHCETNRICGRNLASSCARVMSVVVLLAIMKDETSPDETKDMIVELPLVEEWLCAVAEPLAFSRVIVEMEGK